MAYQNYFPVTYQPYQQSYYQPYQQPVQMQQPVLQQPQQTSIIWVSGDKEAAMYPVAPNNAVTLWSQSEPVVYLKQADASGKPVMKIYDLVERTTTAQNGAQAQDVKTPAFATKDDLNSVLGAVKGFDGLIGGMREELNGMRSEIDTMRGDMYGIAGKRKAPVKKQEADDE